MKLGYALSQHPQSLEGAQLLTDKLKLVLESSAKGKEVDLTDTATGKVPANRTPEIFTEGNVRERMAVIYSAIRTGLGGAIAETADSPDADVSGIVNADKVNGCPMARRRARGAATPARRAPRRSRR